MSVYNSIVLLVCMYGSISATDRTHVVMLAMDDFVAGGTCAARLSSIRLPTGWADDDSRRRFGSAADKSMLFHGEKKILYYS